MGGVTGSLLIGAFASHDVNPTIQLGAVVNSTNEPVYGLLFGLQLGAVALAAAYAFAFTCLIVFITKPRLSATQQLGHIDELLHGEEAYGLEIALALESQEQEYQAKDKS